MEYSVKEQFHTKVYQHEPLKGSEQIRLLKLAPGNENEPVSCTPHVTSLEAAPSYETISYNWGDPAGREIIYCDGRQLKVTKNLIEALRQLRFKDIPRMLWADAACINQSDLDERSQQLAFDARNLRAHIQGSNLVGRWHE